MQLWGGGSQPGGGGPQRQRRRTRDSIRPIRLTVTLGLKILTHSRKSGIFSYNQSRTGFVTSAMYTPSSYNFSQNNVKYGPMKWHVLW